MANSTSSNPKKDTRVLDVMFGLDLAKLEQGTSIVNARGSSKDAQSYLNSNGTKYISPINKLHIIRFENDLSYDEGNLNSGFYIAKNAVDLCQMSDGAVSYDIEDFLYCKHVGVPINRLITLRRFPVPCMDNIYDITKPWEEDGGKGKTKITETPDLARMVCYMTNDTNKMEDILSMSYNLKWKELTADMEQATMFGEQSGVSGFIKKVAKVMDKTTGDNFLDGSATGGPMGSYDPKHDQNRVYGPVDSISTTNIRDVGLEFNKEFEITFDYELRSINGRTPEAAMKDLIANVLAVTYNNGKFWGGSRYWVGERPSPWASKLQWMNSRNLDTVMQGMMETLKTTFSSMFTKESALNTLKSIVKGGFKLALGKILDGLGRPGIPAMNSLLSSDPTGCWHLMIGNPTNPIICMGNLILTGTDIKFPTDALSKYDFPTKLQVVVKLKPGMPYDRAGIERIFNKGKSRLYYNPEKVYFKKAPEGTTNYIQRNQRLVDKNFQGTELGRLVGESFDFLPIENDNIKLPNIDIDNVSQNLKNTYNEITVAKKETGASVDIAAEQAEQRRNAEQAKAKPQQV